MNKAHLLDMVISDEFVIVWITRGNKTRRYFAWDVSPRFTRLININTPKGWIDIIDGEKIGYDTYLYVCMKPEG